MPFNVYNLALRFEIHFSRNAHLIYSSFRRICHFTFCFQFQPKLTSEYIHKCKMKLPWNISVRYIDRYIFICICVFDIPGSLNIYESTKFYWISFFLHSPLVKWYFLLATLDSSVYEWVFPMGNGIEAERKTPSQISMQHFELCRSGSICNLFWWWAFFAFSIYYQTMPESFLQINFHTMPLSIVNRTPTNIKPTNNDSEKKKKIPTIYKLAMLNALHLYRYEKASFSFHLMSSNRNTQKTITFWTNQ